MSKQKRVDRLARYLSLGRGDYQLLIEDEEGNLIDGSGQIAYTPEEWERWELEHVDAVIDISRED